MTDDCKSFKQPSNILQMPFENKDIELLIGLPSYGWSYKITVVCLSVCLSVCLCLSVSFCQFWIFLKNGSLVFSDFLHDGR